MKKRFARVLSVLVVGVLLVLCAVTTGAPIAAHPGRTDSQGGHWNRKEGTYHYHGGSSSKSATKKPKTKKKATPKPSSKPKSVATSKPASASKTPSATMTPAPLDGTITIRVSRETNLYKEADKESQVLTEIPAGTTLTVTAETKFYYVTTFQGKEGFVSKKDVK